MCIFAFTSDVPHITADCIRALVLQDILACLFQVICPFPAGRIIQTDHKIRHRSSADPLFNLLPRCQKITQTDHCKIMHQRCTKNCRTAICRRDPRHDLQLHLRVALSHLIEQTCHSVNSGIPTAYHSYRTSFHRLIHCHLTADHFLPHWCGKVLFIRKPFPYQSRIYGIPDNNLTFFQCRGRLVCHFFLSTRSKTDYIDFSNFTHFLHLLFLCPA